jgi:hypothetical protein
VYRRIFLDGRKPSQRVLDDPTFAGYSTGHWEGDTLVVDTVAIREDTLFDRFSPHSDQFTVRERIRFRPPGERGLEHHPLDGAGDQRSPRAARRARALSH